MIANPKEIPPEVLSGASVREKACVIKKGDYRGLGCAGEFALTLQGDPMTVIACAVSARALSRWAFIEGALSVRHDYDLRLDHP